MTTRTRVPKYRLHKASGQAVVTLDGRDHYLGKHGTARSKAEYRRIIAEYLAAGDVRPAAKSQLRLTIAGLVERYLRHQQAKLSGRTAEPTLGRIRLSLAHLQDMYSHTQATNFGPRALQAIRQSVIDAGLSRSVTNERIWRIKRMFRWAVAEQFVPMDLAHGLEAVENLRFGEFGVRRTEPVEPV